MGRQPELPALSVGRTAWEDRKDREPACLWPLGPGINLDTCPYPEWEKEVPKALSGVGGSLTERGLFFPIERVGGWDKWH